MSKKTTAFQKKGDTTLMIDAYEESDDTEAQTKPGFLKGVGR